MASRQDLYDIQFSCLFTKHEVIPEQIFIRKLPCKTKRDQSYRRLLMAQPPHNNLPIMTHRQEETFLAYTRCNLPNKHNLAGMKVNLSVIMRPMLDINKENFSLICA